MHEQSWTNAQIDRSKWPAGAWDGEPDKVQWKDEATGLDCLAVRHPRSGHWCGYVGVAPGHKLHGKGYSAEKTFPCSSECKEGDEGYHYACCPESVLRVHGGLTFAEGCEHSSDPSRGVCHVPAAGEPDALWWLGFDCAHSGDASPYDYSREGEGYPWTPVHGEYRPLSYIKSECAKLAEQIAALPA